MFSGSFDTRLAVSEDPAAGTLVFRQLHSSFMRTFEGRWQARACLPVALLRGVLGLSCRVPRPLLYPLCEADRWTCAYVR